MQLHEAANILGVSVTADLDTLKAAYRKMALQWHPDKCKDPKAKERFQQVSVAYTRLVAGEEDDDAVGGEAGGADKYYDDMDEMRVFMRMFMDLVGMFNDMGGGGGTAPTSAASAHPNAAKGGNHHHHSCCRGGMGPASVAFSMMFGDKESEEWSTEEEEEEEDEDYDEEDDDEDDVDTEDEDEDDEEEDGKAGGAARGGDGVPPEAHANHKDAAGGASASVGASDSSVPAGGRKAAASSVPCSNMNNCVWEPMVRHYFHMNLKEEIQQERDKENAEKTEADKRKKEKAAKRRAEKKKRRKEKKAKEAESQVDAEEEERQRLEEARAREAEEAEKARKEAARQKRLDEEQRRATLFSATRAGELESVQALLLEPSSGLRCSEREKARGTSGASLLHACVSPDSDPLAALRLSVAQFLLGQDKECRLLDLAWLDDDGCAVLHRVAEKNDLPFFDLLVEERKRSPERRAQIDLEARCLCYGWTPLHYAGAGGHLAMVTALVENGARISLTSSPPTSASGDSFKSETPLELVKRLLAAEPQPTATANGSSTAGKKGNAAEQSKRRKDLEAVKAALTKAVAAVEKARQVKEEKERAARLQAEKEEAAKQEAREKVERELLERKQRQLREKAEREKRRQQEEEEEKRRKAAADEEAKKNKKKKKKGATAAPLSISATQTAAPSSAQASPRGPISPRPLPPSPRDAMPSPARPQAPPSPVPVAVRARSPSPPPRPASPTSTDGLLSQLLQMGFAHDKCLEAIRVCGASCELETIISWLCERAANSAAESSRSTAPPAQAPAPAPAPPSGPLNYFTNQPTQLKPSLFEEQRRINRKWNATKIQAKAQQPEVIVGNIAPPQPPQPPQPAMVASPSLSGIPLPPLSPRTAPQLGSSTTTGSLHPSSVPPSSSLSGRPLPGPAPLPSPHGSSGHYPHPPPPGVPHPTTAVQRSPGLNGSSMPARNYAAPPNAPAARGLAMRKSPPTPAYYNPPPPPPQVMGYGGMHHPPPPPPHHGMPMPMQAGPMWTAGGMAHHHHHPMAPAPHHHHHHGAGPHPTAQQPGPTVAQLMMGQGVAASAAPQQPPPPTDSQHWPSPGQSRASRPVPHHSPSGPSHHSPSTASRGGSDVPPPADLPRRWISDPTPSPPPHLELSSADFNAADGELSAGAKPFIPTFNPVPSTPPPSDKKASAPAEAGSSSASKKKDEPPPAMAPLQAPSSPSIPPATTTPATAVSSSSSSSTTTTTTAATAGWGTPASSASDVTRSVSDSTWSIGGSSNAIWSSSLISGASPGSLGSSTTFLPPAPSVVLPSDPLRSTDHDDDSGHNREDSGSSVEIWATAASVLGSVALDFDDLGSESSSGTSRRFLSDPEDPVLVPSSSSSAAPSSGIGSVAPVTTASTSAAPPLLMTGASVLGSFGLGGFDTR